MLPAYDGAGPKQLNVRIKLIYYLLLNGETGEQATLWMVLGDHDRVDQLAVPSSHGFRRPQGAKVLLPGSTLRSSAQMRRWVPLSHLCLTGIDSHTR